MNSDVSRAWLGAAAAAALGLLLGACADHGPTNLYSQPLFGVHQDGANLVVWKVEADSLSLSAGTSDLVGLVVTLKNTGQGGTVGPVHALLSTTACATVNLASAVFGSSGQVIQPGDEIRGQAVYSNGSVANSHYAFESTYNLAACPGSQVNFSVNATDPYGSAWTSGFNTLSQ